MTTEPTYGVEPICAELPIAPSVYYEHKRRDRETRPLLGPQPPGRGSCAPRFGGCGSRTSGCTEPARFGASYIVKGSGWLDARWSASCGKKA